MSEPKDSETQFVKLRYSVGIATKMIFIVTLIVVTAIGVVVWIASDLFREDSITRIQEANKDSAQQLAERVQSVLEDTTDRIRLPAQFATKSASADEASRAIRNTILTSEDIVSFLAFKVTEDGILALHSFAVNESALAEFEIAIEKFEAFQDPESLKRQISKAGEVVVKNSSKHFGVPLFSVSFLSEPLADKSRWLFRSEIRQDRVIKLFQSQSFSDSYLVDAQGRLMAHSDRSQLGKVLASAPMTGSDIVTALVDSVQDNRQMSYQGAFGERYLGAYKKTSISGLAVVTEVPESKALATIVRVQYRSFLVMVVVVCIAFVLNFGFSKSLTANLRKLFEATEKIVEGQFDVKLEVKSSDEIGALAKAFTSMSAGLKEREKIKDAFDKFHSKEVAKKLLSGEIKLGGEKKRAAVFFSDIRGFTAFSEKMSPDQVVSLLNEYFTAMVKIIYGKRGIVDKYIGDAILAVWGVPESSGQDAYHAVRASLEMREFLKTWNEKRKAKDLMPLQIGVGIHFGEVLSGNIGAYERKLEYTVIGDTVNQASRIEGACKAVGSDILISDETWAVVHEKGIECGPAIEIKAKGKSKPLRVHQVIGWKDETGTLHTCLSPEEVRKIQEGIQQMDEVEEAKTSVLRPEKVQELSSSMEVPHSTADQVMATELMMSQHDVNKAEWYVVHDPGSKEYQGPFSLNQILAKLSDGQLSYGSAYVFRQGDSQMTPVTQIAQLDRRVKNPFANIQMPDTVQPETVIRQQATPEEWYVAGPDGKTLGPYSEDELRVMLGKGHITRTTFIWKKGMANWIHLHQMPNFDRRAA